MSTYTSSDLVPTWVGLVDDAAIFPPGNADLADAVAAFQARREQWYADLVGSLVVRDTDLAGVGEPLPLSIVITGGAGAIEGPVRMAARKGHRVVGVEIALRDPDDLPGNARRVNAAVDAARDAGVLDEQTRVHVELPAADASHGWLAAADVVAEGEHRLKFRTGGTDPIAIPAPETLAAWIDAALDRELAFKCTAGLHRAVRHTTSEGFDRPVDQHGFLNVLLATGRLFDGGSASDAIELLELRDDDRLVTEARSTDLAAARRWFTSFGSCSVTEPLETLVATGLLEDL